MLTKIIIFNGLILLTYKCLKPKTTKFILYLHLQNLILRNIFVAYDQISFSTLFKKHYEGLKTNLSLI